MPNLVLTTSTVPGNASWQNIASLVGDVTIIPNGGTMEGTYGNVICQGTATITGPLTVQGNLTALGTITNSGGYAVEVKGDLNAQDLDFTKSNPATPQSNFTVDGDLFFTSILFPQYANASATLQVGGDLIGKTILASITANGITSGTNGANVLVFGSVSVFNLYVNGADGTSSDAGDGGDIHVHGLVTLHWDEVNFIEGRIWDNGGFGQGLNYNGGNGGSILFHSGITGGGYTGAISMQGGSATQGNGGQGGYFRSYGPVTLAGISLSGGACLSSNVLHTSGSGGSSYVWGKLDLYDFDAPGGTRYGTLSASNFNIGGAGGSLNVFGDMNLVNYLDLSGGGSYTSNFFAQNGGTGGQLIVTGNLTSGSTIGSQGVMFLNGGDSSYGYGGNSGFIQVYGDIFVSTVYVNGGGSNSFGYGGNSSPSSIVYGNARFSTWDGRGGFGEEAGAGAGGSVTFYGQVQGTTIYLSGGYCDSTVAAHEAGNAGTLNCPSGGYIANVYMYGGNRLGTTTIAASNTPPSGGILLLGGNFTSEVVNLNGGNVTTAQPNSVGGSGGLVQGGGTKYFGCTFFSAKGGLAVGAEGGAGGEVNFYLGQVNSQTFDVSGGNSNTTNGRGGEVIVNGLSCVTYTSLDGAGAGAVPAGSTSLTLGGNCTIGTLSMPNRVGAYILPKGTYEVPAILRVNTFTAKTTLNNSNLSQTAAVTPGCLHFSSATGWFKLTGVAM